MELRMSFNDFIKIKSIFKINDLSGEVLDFKVNENEINGILGITGTYQLDDLVDTHTINSEIPFNFVFADNDVMINDVDCINLDYELIDGRGLEVSFDILIDYNRDSDNTKATIDETVDESIEHIDTLGEVNTTILPDEERVEIKSEQENNGSTSDEIKGNVTEISVDNTQDDNTSDENDEKIKEKITEEINRKLESSLSYKDDNFPTNETFLDQIEDRKSQIKICYYANDNELEKICKKNNLSINQVFQSNSNNNINKTRRVIINEQK